MRCASTSRTEYMEIERVLQNAEIIAAAMYELAK